MEFYTKNKSSNEIFISAIQIFIKLDKSGISICLGYVVFVMFGDAKQTFSQFLRSSLKSPSYLQCCFLIAHACHVNTTTILNSGVGMRGFSSN